MFASFVQAHREEMVSTLQDLLRIPSVKGPAVPNGPFGHATAEALQYMLDLGSRHGLRVKNVDGYAGHIEYGEGDEYVGVLSHLDVVPEGTGWTYPPFGAEIHDGKVYARGAVDDKGPAMSTFWALVALKELGMKPRRKIRLIFGLDEESDWECMKYYFEKEPAPLGGFTPDADFPMIYAEKGVCTLVIRVAADTDSLNPQVIRFEGGHRDNMVPDYALAVVDCHSETAASEWEQRIRKDARARQIDVDVEQRESHVEIRVRGVSAHGSMPHLGRNAIVSLAQVLSGQPVSNASMWRFVAAQDHEGKNLGIDDADDVTGALTSNLGCAALRNGQFELLFNIRFPVHLSADQVLERCRQYIPDKWFVDLRNTLDPLYVPLESPVIRVLQNVYRTQVGFDSEPLAIGGATYARTIPNAVAFGPQFPGDPDCAHQADESWSLERYLQCIQIYAHAMFELANTL
ncbi:dipeptidase PepV [Alicyclobacillus contaminans]|uniref:dipeptidase PepV n=1 Tax=Alicyclobacillus contaminans TaxID=392016 RepID=UPI000404592E|nr:dipeptidase PepV [Alicyclobacillus contaminans]GMA52502.1 dipeptidase PepV [Alicyclobacillus contaminans]